MLALSRYSFVLRVLGFAYAIAASIPLFATLNLTWVYASALLVTLSMISFLSAQNPRERSFQWVHISAKLSMIALLLHYVQLQEATRLLKALLIGESVIALFLIYSLFRIWFLREYPDAPYVEPKVHGTSTQK